jgi:hypothetical protein
MITRRSTTLVAGIAVAALLLAGCGDEEGGDGGSDRPTADEVAAVLPTEGLDADGIDCLAEAFVASAISDEGLRSIVEAGNVTDAEGLTAIDQQALQSAAAEAVRCTTANNLPSATATTEAGDAGEPPASDVPPSEPATTAAG